MAIVVLPTYSLPFASGHFVEYLLERSDVKQAWHRFSEHDFVKGIAAGTLPLSAFKSFLIQDYLYLVHFARANALAAYKASTMADIGRSAEIVLHIQRETALHVEYCAEFGLQEEEIMSTPETLTTTAYTRYILDIGHTSDYLALQMAMAPCLLGYGAIAERLHADPATAKEGNRYWKWMENYVADDYREAVRKGSELLEQHAVKQSPSRIEELVEIFVQAIRMETAFWDDNGRTT